MSENSKNLKNLSLKLSKEDYINYKEELEKIMKGKKDEYSDLNEIFESFNQKKIHLSFLLFSHYNKWIFPSISHNNIISFNSCSSESKIIYIFNKLNQNMNSFLDDKIFILWYFYLFYNFFIKGSEIKSNIINPIRYLLLESNKVVSILYEKKNLSINNIFNILNFYLLSLEHFINSLEYFNLSEKIQNSKKLIFFKNFFDLIERISIISIKSNQINDFESLLKFLNKINNNNSELNDEINNNLLVSNNIIQDFINNLLKNLDYDEIEKIMSKYNKELTDIYARYLKYKYKFSNLFSNIMDTSKKSFEHLYNFRHNKNLIFKDIFINTFNIMLINKLYSIEQENISNQNEEFPLESSFLFNHKNSNISVKIEKLELNKVIIFFSFKIGKENNNFNNDKELPLILIKKTIKNNEELFLKIFLKKIESNEKDKINYHLCSMQIKDSSDKIINIINTKEDNFIIDSNNTYYCSFLLNDKKIKFYLYNEILGKNNNILIKENTNFIPMKKEERLIFIIGNDEINSFYKGKIGPIIMIETPKKDKISSYDIDIFISAILLLKEKYSDFIITNSDLSKNYSFYLKEYYEHNLLDNITEKNMKDKQEINRIKGNFECLLYLHPNRFKYIENNDDINDGSTELKIFPIMSDLCNNKLNYCLVKLLQIKVSIINYEKIKNLFIKDNGLYYICLQIEYFNQFAKYFLLKNKIEEIYNKEELDSVLKHIKMSLNTNLFLLGIFTNNSNNLLNIYKKTFVSLYHCLLNLNKISPIINDIYNDLYLLKNIYKGIAMNLQKFSFNIIQVNVKGFNLIQNINQFDNKINIEDNNYFKSIFFTNISYYIGIIEIMLTPEFYNNSQKEKNIQLIQTLFKNLLSDFDGNNENTNFINISFYENIFYKLLYFIIIITSYFNIKEDEVNNDKMNNDKENTYIELLKQNFNLLISILNMKNDDRSIKISSKFFHKIFKFVFGNNRENSFIVYSYLFTIYNYKKENCIFKLKEVEINQLTIYLNELYKKEKRMEKLDILLISIILEFLFSNPNIKILNDLNYIEDFIRNIEISKELLNKIKDIIKKYFIDIFDENNKDNFIIKKFNNQEMMKYFNNLFNFIIVVFKKVIKLNQINDKKNDNDFDFNNYLNEILNILSILEKKNEESMNTNNLDKNIIFYLINFLKFSNSILIDDEINFLFNNKAFLEVIEGAFKNCFQSSLIHSNIYLLIKKKDNSRIKETKKLISEIFFDFLMIHLEQIYDKYCNSTNKEIISDDELYFLQYISKIFETNFMIEFNYSTYNFKKNSEYDDYETIYFISDYLKLILSDKKLSKKYEKNKIISQRLKFYKDVKEIIIDIDNNNKDNNNNKIFDFYFTSYFFYKIYKFKTSIEYFKNNTLIDEKLIKQLKEINSVLFKFSTIILNDHLKLNKLFKDFYKKTQINDSALKNLLKAIQNILFNKKNKNKFITDLVNEIEKEIPECENNSKNGRNSENLNTKLYDEVDNNIPKSKTKKYSIDLDRNNEENNDIKIEEDNKDEEITYIVNNKNEASKEQEITNNINKSNNDLPLEEKILNNNINETKVGNIEEKENNLNEEIPLLELTKDLYSKNIFDKIDKSYVINPKKELMKNIFGIYFEHSFFNNKLFKKMRNYYLNFFKGTEPSTKLLNFPTKIKSFTNGLEPPLFLKENKKFFISKIFPITHKYFYTYMNEHNILNESIILLKENILVPFNNLSNNLEKKEFDCELIKIDKTYYGHISIINTIDGELLLFKQKDFKLSENEKNLKEEFEKNIFSLSSLEIIVTNNTKMARKNAKNSLLYEDVFPEGELNSNKTVIIFYSDIEEIVERRILYLWQGVEIFLKNGKSFIFNMLNKENYSSLINYLKQIKGVLFREKDFFSKTPVIEQNWIEEKMDTYEYLLFLNKYGSRSLNDSSQYYVFPWILTDFSNLIEINVKESDIYEFIEKKKNAKLKEIQDSEKDIQTKIQNNSDNENNTELFKLYNNFRKLRYPVSAQTLSNRESKIEKYNDEDEKFHHHYGTHYSNGSYIFYYLMRLEPFTSLLVELQNYSQENPDRMLNDLKDTINIINSGNDNRELIPELFCKVDYFININCAYYGHKKNKLIVDDIVKVWKNYHEPNYNPLSISTEFIIEHKKLLNSNSIAININNWIDNVFGIGQLPPVKKREKSFNIFLKTSYPEFTNLHKKLDKIFQKENDIIQIKKRFINKLNLIISFGQTPQQIFNEKHKDRKINHNEKNLDLEEQNPENFGHKDDYIGNDFIDTFIVDNFKKEDNIEDIKIPGIYLEINSFLGKIFILSETNEIEIINTSFYNLEEPKEYHFNEILSKIKLPFISFFEKFKVTNTIDFYLFKIKYCFSSFPINILNSNGTSSYLYSNNYIKYLNKKNEEIIFEKFKFITCRHLDNSFKIHSVINQKKTKNIETYSFICEDFVMSCKAISQNSFIIGLKNGKLIKASIYEYKSQKDKTKKQENINDKYKIIFDNYIQGHKGSINVIEIDQKLGIIITGGDDNKLYIRKLYDFELLTSIKLKSKYIITMAKISPMNFLYIMCYNKEVNGSRIFGYTLSGLKFAKSIHSYYTNLDFTKNGNIISLVDDYEITILNGHNLNEIKINKTDKDYEKYLQVKKDLQGVKWMQFDYFKNYYGKERNIISYLSKDSNSNQYYFKTLKVTNISYFE